MTLDRNPQAEQMADESMVRNLAAQAEAIWPQEEQLLARYALPHHCAIADIGSGSGEISSRLALRYPESQVLGVDILASSVEYAASKYASLAPRLKFIQSDLFERQLPANQFDLVICRHVTQAVPHVERLLGELWRLCKPGGWVHVLSEDYGMLHFTPGAQDPDQLWHEGAIAYCANSGTDARIGRRTWALLHALGLEELRVDYAVVDTLRVPRATFAAILEAWRDGYVDAVASNTALSAEKVRALYEHCIANIRNPAEYAVWHVPIVSGRKPLR
jgi:ubiquinone/menaquinone biosynthesis C-methylase UbiE